MTGIVSDSIVYAPIDGSIVLHKIKHIALTRYSSPDKTTPPSPTILAFLALQSLFKMIDETNITNPIVLWDDGAPAFRSQLYEGYKASRSLGEDATPFDHELRDNFYKARAILHNWLPKINIVSVLIDGTEADDIGYFLTNGILRNKSGQLITDDMDWLQSITETFCINRYYRKGQIILHSDMMEWYGQPYRSNYVLAKALSGDSSDEVPGVMTENAMNKLINSLGSIPKVYESLTDDKKLIVDRNRKIFDMSWVMNSEFVEVELLKAFSLVAKSSEANSWIETTYNWSELCRIVPQIASSGRANRVLDLTYQGSSMYLEFVKSELDCGIR